jgi:hypothetical protein
LREEGVALLINQWIPEKYFKTFLGVLWYYWRIFYRTGLIAGVRSHLLG